MADNYLEKKMLEYQEHKLSATRLKVVNIDSLLDRNKRCEKFDLSYTVREDQLQRLVSSLPAEEFDYVIALGDHARQVLDAVDGLLYKANACILLSVSKNDEFKLGMTVQTILLKASEIGLCGMYIRDSLRVIIAIGKPKN